MRIRLSPLGRTLLVATVVAALVPTAFGFAAGRGRAASTVTCPPAPQAKALKFNAPTYIDQSRAGGEPVSVVARDGSIIVSAHAGTTHVYKDPNALPGAPDFVVGYFNQTLNWRSTDGGKTWTYVGLYGNPDGPHTLISTGFSDPDLTIDAAGKIYNTEIDLANDSVYFSKDDGQEFPYANPIAGSGDRPWLTGADANVVYLYINSPHQLLKSTDGGFTWAMVTTSFPATGKLIVDPLNPHHGLIGPDGSNGFAISSDDGQTWTDHPTTIGKSTQFFGTVAVDASGNVYTVAAGGYDGSGDTTPDGQVTFNYYDRSIGQWGAQYVTIPTPSGDALWPWITAGDDGRAALVWYQSLAADPSSFFIYAAETMNGHGTTVTCTDGSTRFIPPQFKTTNASGRPIHVGAICLQGTACNADPNFQDGDRRLGDFFTVNHDLAGNIFIESADTMLTNALGGPKPVANPIFITQSKGSRLLKKPIPAQPPVPPCGIPCMP